MYSNLITILPVKNVVSKLVQVSQIDSNVNYFPLRYAGDSIFTDGRHNLHGTGMMLPFSSLKQNFHPGNTLF